VGRDIGVSRPSASFSLLFCLVAMVTYTTTVKVCSGYGGVGKINTLVTAAAAPLCCVWRAGPGMGKFPTCRVRNYYNVVVRAFPPSVGTVPLRKNEPTRVFSPRTRPTPLRLLIAISKKQIRELRNHVPYFTNILYAIAGNA